VNCWAIVFFLSHIFASLHFDDLQVVSPDQATTIYKAIKDKGLPVALVEYEGEQHGFRKVSDHFLSCISL
jgi:acetyl esterase/lipase